MGFWRNLEIQDGGPRWPPLKNDDAIPTSCDVISSLCGRQEKQFSTYYLPAKSHGHSFNALEVPPPPPHHKAQGRKPRLNRVKDISGCGYCSIVHFSFAILPTNQWMIPSVVTVMAFHLFSGSFTSQERMYVLIGDRTGHPRKLREVLKICKGRNKGSTVVLSYLRSVATTHSLLPLGCKLNLPLSGPRNWLYRDDATMEKSGIWPLSMPRGEKHSLGIPCK